MLRYQDGIQAHIGDFVAGAGVAGQVVGLHDEQGITVSYVQCFVQGHGIRPPNITYADKMTLAKAFEVTGPAKDFQLLYRYVEPEGPSPFSGFR